MRAAQAQRHRSASREAAHEKAEAPAGQQEAARRKRELKQKRVLLEQKISGMRLEYETEAAELRRIAEQVGTRTLLLATDRAASGHLRQADVKVAVSTRENARNGH